MKLTRNLYKAARISNDFGALTSGSNRRLGNRVKNKVKAKLLGKVIRTFWKF